MSGDRRQPWHKAPTGGRTYILDQSTGRMRFAGIATAIRFGDGDWENISRSSFTRRRWRKRMGRP